MNPAQPRDAWARTRQTLDEELEACGSVAKPAQVSRTGHPPASGGVVDLVRRVVAMLARWVR